MSKEMKIVGLHNKVHVLFRFEENGTWTRAVMTRDEFENFMRTEFPAYVEKYDAKIRDDDMADWFYHYGETPLMISKGEVYVYTA